MFCKILKKAFKGITNFQVYKYEVNVGEYYFYIKSKIYQMIY